MATTTIVRRKEGRTASSCLDRIHLRQSYVLPYGQSDDQTRDPILERSVLTNATIIYYRSPRRYQGSTNPVRLAQQSLRTSEAWRQHNPRSFSKNFPVF